MLVLTIHFYKLVSSSPVRPPCRGTMCSMTTPTSNDHKFTSSWVTNLRQIKDNIEGKNHYLKSNFSETIYHL